MEELYWEHEVKATKRWVTVEEINQAWSEGNKRWAMDELYQNRTWSERGPDSPLPARGRPTHVVSASAGPPPPWSVWCAAHIPPPGAWRCGLSVYRPIKHIGDRYTCHTSSSTHSASPDGAHIWGNTEWCYWMYCCILDCCFHHSLASPLNLQPILLIMVLDLLLKCKFKILNFVSCFCCYFCCCNLKFANYKTADVAGPVLVF